MGKPGDVYGAMHAATVPDGWSGKYNSSSSLHKSVEGSNVLSNNRNYSLTPSNLSLPHTDTFSISNPSDD